MVPCGHREYSGQDHAGTAADWKSGAITDQNSFAIKTDGTLWAWGDNYYYQLGIGDDWNDKWSPTQVGTDTDWKAVSARYRHVLAIKTDGTLYTWGDNEYGQLGNGDSGKYKQVKAPARIGTDSDWASVYAGSYHSFALKTDDTLWAWGLNGGTLGDGTTDLKSTPTMIGADTDWAFIATQHDITFAIKNDGSLWAWGENMWGQIGDGTTDDKLMPTRISVE